jgi:urease accessory protein
MLLIQRHVQVASARPAAEQVRLRVERRMFLKRRWRGTAEDGVEFGFDLAGRLHSSNRDSRLRDPAGGGAGL